MKICMLLHKSVVHDSRVRREAKALAAAGHDVTVVHLAPATVPPEVSAEGYRVLSALPRRLARRHLPFAAHRLALMRCFVGAVRAVRPDAVHAHDAAMLAPGYVVARLTKAKLVYDSHELATGVAYRERSWAHVVAVLERIVLPRCAGVITVSDGIADRLQDKYGLLSRPLVVRNLPDLRGALAGGAGLRERLGVGSAPLVLHQGALAPGRGCETLVDAVSQLPDVHLLFLGDAWPDYQGVVERRAAVRGLVERVHFISSVPLEELPCYTREADVGVSLLSDDCENHRLALPNKVFEYIAAGVPVVTSDLPELRRLVDTHRVGTTVDASDPAKLATALSTMVAAREHHADALTRAGHALSWEREQHRLLDVYQGLSQASGRPRRRALVFVRNTVTHDSRVLREARLLDELGYDASVVGVVSTAEQQRETNIGGVRIRRLAPGRLRRAGRRTPELPPSKPRPPAAAPPEQPGLRRTLRRLALALDWYRRGTRIVARERPWLVHCNDYNTAWIGVAAKLLTGSRFVYDAHELWPDRNLRPEPRAWLLACERLFTHFADRVVTTSPGYAEVMAGRYRIERPLVVRNIPEAPASLRNGGGSNGAPLALYYGALTHNRGLEDAIAALLELPELRLRLVGPDAWGFRGKLARFAERLEVADRVELREPVAAGRGWSVMSDADVGLALIQPSCLSYELTLPNKLFEYTAAGVPVLGTPLPMIAEFISRHGVGLTAAPGDVGDVVAKLRAMLEPETNARMREATRKAAATLTWASEREHLATAYQELAV